MLARLAVGLVIAGALAGQVEAQPGSAKALFEEGRKLIEAADKLTDPTAKATQVAVACDKFAASLAADALLGTKLNLADCRVRQGKLVEAYALVESAAEEASRTHDRESFAKQQLAALAGKLVRVTLHVAQPDVAGTVVKLGGREVPRAEWTKVQVVAPGPIVVDVSAPDHQPAQIPHDGPAGVEITIEIPALAPIAAAPPPVDTTPRRSKIPYAVIGGGGVFVLTSVVLGLHARSRYNTAKMNNDMPGVSSAQHEADLATVFVGVGAVAVGVGIWLYIRDTPKDKVVAMPVVTRDTAGLAVIGTF